ncbi:cation:proton antiporter [Solicola gregarius]|uniref:Sodium:proton antiporter n=1 Tax=Solicola gregarius TaxID=2908642 RepID=A0AA46TKM4_9ACTN|nr:sodium:proton antiporter [Solicola gregarius]UYM06649.1 sodium:proton antiporter [Solicola gregarius]
MELLVIGVLGLLVIAGCGVLADRIGLAAPLVLVVVGIAISVLPFTPEIEIEPELILAGLLPPLLYSAAVSVPTMNLRRDFGAVGGLSIALVVLSSLVLGAFFSWAIPGLDFAWGVALGAVISPTDAAANAIAKRMGVAPRVMVILEGESLFNDATALVLLRTAVATAAASFSLWQTLGKFAFAVGAAVVIGFVVGHLGVYARARVDDSAINTVLSFTVPFVASIPAEAVDASGLVAAVVAGVVTGWHGPRDLSPQHRLSDTQNWRTVELVLEGAIFLLMGLELSAVIGDVHESDTGIGPAVGLSLVALTLTILIRAAYTAPLLRALRRRSERRQRLGPRLNEIHERLHDPEKVAEIEGRAARRTRRRTFDIERFRVRIRRLMADLDYYLESPLSWRDGGVLVWSGMRGAVTVAAAQTLPEDAPHRSVLVLIAYAVATFSLLIQGGTLSTAVRLLRPSAPDPEHEREERAQILTLLRAVEVPADDLSPKQHALALVRARRVALLNVRDDGSYDAEGLTAALESLDAQEISLVSQGDPSA